MWEQYETVNFNFACKRYRACNQDNYSLQDLHTN